MKRFLVALLFLLPSATFADSTVTCSATCTSCGSSGDGGFSGGTLTLNTCAPVLQVPSTGAFNFSGGACGASSDTGLARSAAGVVRVTDGGAGGGTLRVGNGTAAAPALTGTTTATGLYFGATAIGMSVSGGGTGVFSDVALRMGSAKQVGWSSNTNPDLALEDTGLARAAAGVVRHTNGSTGLGYAIGGVSVEANTGTKAPAITESGELYTNTGDADGSTINLPNDPTIGTTYTVTATVAQNITVAPAAGESIMFGNTTCATSFVIGGAATGIGDSATLVAVTGGSGAVWMTTAYAGTPTCTP